MPGQPCSPGWSAATSACLARDGVRRVRLQMMQTAPMAERLTTAVADGDSLRYYPAYDLPGRSLLPPQAPAAARARAQLLMVQRADGGLTIGDTHEYDEPFAFDVDSDAYDHLQARAEALLGAPIPRDPAPLGRRLQRGRHRPGALPPVRARARRRAGHRAGRPGHDLRPGHRGGDVPMTRITVACLDMAGTTVRDDGTVLDAFAAAVAAQNLPVAAYNQAMTDVRSSMGQSKIEVFRRILGDEQAAQQANEAFEDHYAAAVRAGHVAAMPGATDVFKACRDAGIRVCLATGFSPTTRDAIISELGWGDLIDLALSPADAGRGRPWPDLPLTALLFLHGGAVSELAVAGDTASDVESGLRAGAGIVAGVLTGASSRADLEQAGAPLILDSIAGILPYLIE